jgi:hypothetical protein
MLVWHKPETFLVCEDVSGHDFQSCRKAFGECHFLAAAGLRVAKRSAQKNKDISNWE